MPGLWSPSELSKAALAPSFKGFLGEEGVRHMFQSPRGSTHRANFMPGESRKSEHPSFMNIGLTTGRLRDSNAYEV